MSKGLPGAPHGHRSGGAGGGQCDVRRESAPPTQALRRWGRARRKCAR